MPITIVVGIPLLMLFSIIANYSFRILVAAIEHLNHESITN